MGMSKEKLLMQQVSLLVAAAALVSPTVPIAKPGCPNSCGNLAIPYPFGTRKGCYLDDDVQCYTRQPIRTIVIPEGNWVRPGRIYSFSYSLNKLIAVGCNTTARFTGYLNLKGYGYFTNCSANCYSYDSLINGSCSGVGCCQISILKDSMDFSVGLESYYNRSDSLEYSPCSYAFVVEDGFYAFNTLDLTGLQTIDQLPVVFDWTIGDTTCVEAQKNQTTYACRSQHSECIDSDERPGYLCNCSVGFHGNPYLPSPHGCQDVDECANTKLNDCASISTCNNTVGSYTCICPKGYIGDGRKNGLGCLAKKLGPSLKFVVFVGVGSGFGFLLLLLGLWLLYMSAKRRQAKKMKQKFFKRNGGLLLEQQLSSTEKHVEQTKLFSSKELEIATDYYNVDRILGQGGQGTVYKGMLTDGRVVAVKKSKVVDEDKLDQFINEVVILSQINHRNVVKLFGCCLETEVPLLVYEFIPNGTLFEFLHNREEQDFSLTWRMRLQIATEVAGAVAYLHSSASMPIYHRDIKTSNILLDEKYRAKVADFGTSKSISIDETHVTTRVQGTFGYLDPEYFQSSQFTEKSDVYSFGVVLVELLTGQKPISMLRSIEGRSLATYFLVTLEEKSLFDIVDGEVLKEGKKEEIIGIAKLAKSCLKLNGKKRPNMKAVAMELERIRTSEGVSSFNESEYDEFDCEFGGYNGPWEITSSSTKSMHKKSLPLISGNTL